jgi:hypothetical protein
VPRMLSAVVSVACGLSSYVQVCVMSVDAPAYSVGVEFGGGCGKPFVSFDHCRWFGQTLARC